MIDAVGMEFLVRQQNGLLTTTGTTPGRQANGLGGHDRKMTQKCYSILVNHPDLRLHIGDFGKFVNFSASKFRSVFVKLAIIFTLAPIYGTHHSKRRIKTIEF